jgi:hypothetical protein
MANVEFYNGFEKLIENSDFAECIAITDRAKDERYDMELVCRFLVLRKVDSARLRSDMVDVGSFLSEEIVKIASGKFNFAVEERAFSKTFKFINSTLGSNAFRRFDTAGKRFLGASQVSAFEAIAIGLGYNISSWNPALDVDQKDFVKRVQRLWSQPDFINRQGSGVRGNDRIINVLLFARTYFKK